MTKRITVLLIALIFLLTACSSGEVDNNDPVVNNDQNSENEQNASADDPEYSPSASAATCTATSESTEVALDPFDHITGAVEDYKITIVEYGDFQ
jgi:PBP1b-binding outer membrane lipoprotein LpoB